MMNRWALSGLGLGVLAILMVISLVILAWYSRRMQVDVGLLDGRLRACAAAGICRCSEFGDLKSFMITGDPTRAWQALVAVINQRSDLRLVSETGDYLHATAHTALFGFVDDLEARLDREASAIHLRSESRVGGSDFGANTKRIESLREAWQNQLSK